MKKFLAGLGTTLALMVGAASAQAADGFVTTNVNLRSGPSVEYPPVAVLTGGTPLEIFGCLDDISWCDVDWRGYRGWVAGQYLQYSYQGRRVYVPEYAPIIGLPIVAFSFNDYWGRYYRGRSWYSNNDRWGPPPRPRPPGGGWNNPGWNGHGKPPPNWGNGPRPPQGNPGWNNPGRPPQQGNPGWNNPGRPPQQGNPGWNNPGRPPQQGNPGWNNPGQGRPPGNPDWNNPGQGRPPQYGRPPQGGPQGGPPQGGNRPPQDRPPQYGRPPQGGPQGGPPPGNSYRPPQGGSPQQGRPPQGGQQGGGGGGGGDRRGPPQCPPGAQCPSR